MIAYGHGTPQGITKLADAELAGRSFPMTSTFHVFANTIINRYKDAMTDVFYPLSVNIAFPDEAYLSTAARQDLLNYIIDRKEIFKIRERKSLMQAALEGWAIKQATYLPAWVAVTIEDRMILGIKEGRSLPLKIKPINDIGRAELQKSLQDYAEASLSVQDASIVSRVQSINQATVDQLFGDENVDIEFAENEEIPNISVPLTKSFQSEILNETTNRIFLHINKLYSKLPSGKPVFFIGSFVNSVSIQQSLKAQGLKYDYQTVFIKEVQLPMLAASSFSPNTQRLRSEQTPISTTAIGTTALDNEVKQESSPQSQTLNNKTDKSSSKEIRRARVSDEFVIQHRFKNQEFLLFKGHKKNSGVHRFYRFISHEDYKQIDKKAAFIKMYKKVKSLYPEVSTLINASAGKYYFLEDKGAKPLAEVIARSRLKKGGRGNFKSEDIQLLIDIYQKLEELPITFRNLTADKIYVRQKDWWRPTGTNEVYFLGLSPEDSTKEKMAYELNEIFKTLVHPTVIERINNT